MKHTPAIQSHTSGCSCRRWMGPIRKDDEQQGEFTTRAMESHRQHVQAQDAQPMLFGAGDVGLFAEGLS